MFTVIYKKAALKALLKMPKPIRLKVEAELMAIAADPRGYVGDWKQLSGSSYWRLRVGSDRAICDIQDEALVLLVLKTGPRGGI